MNHKPELTVEENLLEKLPAKFIEHTLTFVTEKERKSLNRTSKFFNDFSWHSKLKADFSLSDEDIAKLITNQAHKDTDKERRMASFGDGWASLYKRCEEIKRIFDAGSNVFYQLAETGRNSEQYKNMIHDTIFASSVLFKHVFRGFKDMVALCYVEPSKMNSLFWVLTNDENLFHHYFPTLEKIEEACSKFYSVFSKVFVDKYKPLLIEKYNDLNKRVENDLPSCVLM